MTFRLRTFGPPGLTDERGRTPPGLGAGKPLALLCYLALEGEVRRETLATLLWGEVSESKARNAFRQALHRLRTGLGNDVVPHDADTVRIAATADLRVDVREFERALAEGRPEDAVELVAGDFLEGFVVGEPGFDHWADGQRARIRGRFLRALRQAADRSLAEGKIEEALGYARRLSAAEPLDSSAAVLEAEILATIGRVADAREALEVHTDRYRSELGEAPPEEVAAALDRLGSAEHEPGSPGAEPGAARQEPVLRPETLHHLLGVWRGIGVGGMRTVLLVGEPGSGATWLVDELVRRVRPLDRPLVLRGAERMGRHGLPFASLAEALRGVMRAPGLAGASTHLLAEAARLVPELRDRFDLPPADPIEGETGRLRFFEGVASVLDAVAYEQPVLLILEGIGDADGATLDLIHFLVSRLGDSSIMLVMTGAAGRGSRELERRLGNRADVLTLEPLPAESLAALLEARAPELEPAARAEVSEAAGGHPRRALELARRRAAGQALGQAPVPWEAVLRARLDACSARERRVLLTMALVRRPLPVRQLAACSHLPEAGVLEIASRLVAAGLARDRDNGVEPADAGVADAAMEAAGPAARALLAGWAVEALAADRAASAAELAELSAQAGRREEAARYAEAAGRDAARLGAPAIAAEHFRRALEWSDDSAARGRLERLLAGVGEAPRWLASGDGGADAARAGRAWPGPAPRIRALVLSLATVLVLALVAVSVRETTQRMGGDLPGRVVRDTLVLVRIEPHGERVRLGFTGPIQGASERRPLPLGPGDEPEWVGPLLDAGVPVLAAAGGGRIAMESSEGAPGRRLLVVGADGRDTVTLATAASRYVPLAWAPDGSRLLYRSRRGDGRWDLWRVDARGGAPVAVDTGAARSVDEAAWAPDGTRIAWTARLAAGGGRVLFVAFADGSDARRLTEPDSDLFNITWAPAGERVAFTSDRTGGADLHAVEVQTGRAWRLTWDDAHDDHAAFSPDGAFLAFESTRGGEAAVYLMSSWGGEPVRVSGPGQRVSLGGWRGYPPPTLSHFRFRIPPPLEPGQSARLVVEPIYDDYVPRNGSFVRWTALDPDIVALSANGPVGDAGAAAADTFVVARRAGLGRIVASGGGWRADTVWVKVGGGSLDLWRAAGHGPGRVLVSDRSFPLTYGLEIGARVGAPPGPGALAETVPASIALLAPGAPARGPADRPLLLASIEWDPGGESLLYRVEREEHLEIIGPAELSTLGLRVEPDGRVAFLSGDSVRWRSSMRVTGGALHVHRALVRADVGATRSGPLLADVVVRVPPVD